eukprot:TRINITY_DN22435_c0_g1_i2.p1 TRINITY_DN22435_c0_g1~~TRINITY_DN22435_c0_g1_i2.p1  ORF type:complete len:562 (+),score=111.78 TRINITY_DN22435_c0_g1_i2:86-1687(+)
MWGEPQLSPPRSGSPPGMPPAPGVETLLRMAEQSGASPRPAPPVRRAGAVYGSPTVSAVRRDARACRLLVRRAGGARPRPGTPGRHRAVQSPRSADARSELSESVGWDSQKALRGRLALDFSKLVTRERRQWPLRHLGHELTRDLDYEAGPARDTNSARVRGFYMVAQTNRAQRAHSMKGHWSKAGDTSSGTDAPLSPSGAAPQPATPASAPAGGASWGGQQGQPRSRGPAAGVSMERATSRETRAKASARDGSWCVLDLPWCDGVRPQPHTPAPNFEGQAGRRWYHSQRVLHDGQMQWYDQASDGTFKDTARHVKGLANFSKVTSRAAPVSARQSARPSKGVDFSLRPGHTRGLGGSAHKRGTDLKLGLGREQRPPARDGSGSWGAASSGVTTLNVRYTCVDKAVRAPIAFGLQSDRGRGLCSVEDGGRRIIHKINLPAYDAEKGQRLVRRRLDRGIIRMAVQQGRAQPLRRQSLTGRSDGTPSSRRRVQSYGVMWGFNAVRPRQGLGHVDFETQTRRRELTDPMRLGRPPR